MQMYMYCNTMYVQYVERFYSQLWSVGLLASEFPMAFLRGSYEGTYYITPGQNASEMRNSYFRASARSFSLAAESELEPRGPSKDVTRRAMLAQVHGTERGQMNYKSVPMTLPPCDAVRRLWSSKELSCFVLKVLVRILRL